MTDKLSPETIRAQRERLDNLRQECAALIKRLHERCDHSGELLYVYQGGASSYYDPPEYWIEWHCKDCGKQWNTDQDWSIIQKYPNAVRVK